MRPAGLRAAATAAMLFVLAASASAAADYAREKRLADEVAPALAVGEAVTLESAAGRRFLGVLTPAAKPRAAVILVHGMGAHPDFGLIGRLRSGLSERGYTTLAIQMPVPAADAGATAYPALFAEAGERIAAALSFLHSQAMTRIAIVSHGMGARMVNDFLARRPDTRLVAWVPVAISSGRFDSLDGVRFPILDIFAERDLDIVREGAPERAKVLRGIRGSKQAMVYGADHDFGHKEKEVAALIDQLLRPLAK